MTAATSKPKSAPKPAPFENPLIPNKKLRALYTTMVQLRLLEESIGRLQKKARAKSLLATSPGHEACHVATAIDLESGDLTLEARRGVATAFVRGAKVPELLRRASSGVGAPAALESGQLPFTPRGLDRLHLALGAATALKETTPGKVVLAYLHPADLTLPEWQQALELAAVQPIPLIVIALPPTPAEPTRRADLGRLSRLATSSGVPGILVDFADPVAIYRVIQESIERARHNGGAMLMECIPFAPGGQALPPADPIATMETFLTQRQVVTAGWMRQVHARFAERLSIAAR